MRPPEEHALNWCTKFLVICEAVFAPNCSSYGMLCSARSRASHITARLGYLYLGFFKFFFAIWSSTLHWSIIFLLGPGDMKFLHSLFSLFSLRVHVRGSLLSLAQCFRRGSEPTECRYIAIVGASMWCSLPEISTGDSPVCFQYGLNGFAIV